MGDKRIYPAYSLKLYNLELVQKILELHEPLILYSFIKGHKNAFTT